MPATLGNKVLYYLCLWTFHRLEYINRNCRWPGILLIKWFWDLIIFWNAFQTIKHWIVLVVYMLSVYYRVICIAILIISFGIHRNSLINLNALFADPEREQKVSVFCSLIIQNWFLRQEKVSWCVCWQRWSPYQGSLMFQVSVFCIQFPRNMPIVRVPSVKGAP